ncbi:hypothetical protein GQR58_006635 [Nymphon striatum]|nr:hypothetical protein GQR58_006635 [Nymphon striatum]
MHNDAFKFPTNPAKHSEVRNNDIAENQINESTPLCSTVCGNPLASKNCSKVVLTEVSHPSSPIVIRCYAILDEQSNSSFIDPKLTSSLNLSGPTCEYNLTTMTGYRNKVTASIIEGLLIRGVEEQRKYKLPSMYTSESIPDCKSEIASPKIVEMHPHICHLAKYFPEVDPAAEVLILLGRDSKDIMKTECHGDRFPFAHHTALGWALVGGVCPLSTDHKTVMKIDHEHFITQPCFPDMPKHLLAKDLFLESPHDDFSGLSKDDQRFMSIMNAGVHLNKKGNLVMPLPFVDENVLLPNNRNAVFHRTKNTLDRLKRDTAKLHQCIESMQRNINSGHVESVPVNDIPKEGRQWYLPIFPVTNPKKDKTRLVFDASATYDGISLNQKLLQGPDCNNKLKGVLLRFRSGEIGFTADIEAMFYNFYLEPNSKNFTKFFWYEGNDAQSKLSEYRGCVHLFGNRPSPAVAHYGLNYAVTHANTGLSRAKSFITNNFYVDDGLGSCHTAKEAIETLEGAVNVLKRFNIRLHKIASNNSEVLRHFPQTERAETTLSINTGESTVVNTLGLAWDLKTDVLHVNLNLPKKPFTKRGLLATVNSLYDPLGIVNPITLTGKLIQRKLLSLENSSEITDWDTPLSTTFLSEWNEWKLAASSVQRINIPRSYTPQGFGKPIRQEVHVFADASQVAIGAVAYLKSTNDDGANYVSFITSHSKLIPRAATTIPRAELCAALEAANLAAELYRELNLPLQDTCMYSDSRVVLGYLNNKGKSFSNYVTNRVHSILKITEPTQWSFVPTELNPADIASRPHNVNTLLKSPWLEGPRFLWETNVVLDHAVDEIDYHSLPEVKESLRVLSSVTECGSLQHNILKNTSTWCKAVKLAQVVVSFGRRIDGIRQKLGIPIAPRHRNVVRSEAKEWLIKDAQNTDFGDTIKLLRREKDDPRRDHPLASLNPFIDSNQLMRVARISGGDLVAIEAKYHYDCLSLYKNRHRSEQRASHSYAAANESRLQEARAFAELVSYIECSVENGNYIFKLSELSELSELHGLYVSRLHNLGVDKTIHKTRLKIQLLGHFLDGCQEQSDGKNILLVFNEGLKKILKQAVDSRDFEAEAISMVKLVKAVREEIFDWKLSQFTGSFKHNCQEESVPTSLKSLISMLLNGPNVTGQDETETQACLTISQLIHFNAKNKAPVAKKSRHSKQCEPPLPLYVGLHVHTLTRSKNLVNSLCMLGISVSYDRIIELGDLLSDAVCKRFGEEGLVCPSQLRKGLFTVGALDNIDYNPSSTTAKDSFHGTGISIFQFPTATNPGKCSYPIVVQSKVSSSEYSLPESYTTVPAVDCKISQLTVPEATITEIEGNLEGAKTEEVGCTQRAIELLTKEQLEKEDEINWAAFHASKQPQPIDPAALTSLLPLFYEKAATLAMVKHGMDIQRQITTYLNPGQTPVTAFDQPLFTLAKYVQWCWPETYGEDHFVVMFGGLHIEMALWN